MDHSIAYLLTNSQDALERLHDAALFYALTQAFGGAITGHDGWQRMPDPGLAVWGSDPHSLLPERHAADRAVYTHPAAAPFLGAVQASLDEAEAAMRAVASLGMGITLRNLARPNQALRHGQNSDRFAQHHSAVTWPTEQDPAYLIHPDSGGAFPRRLLVVAGQIVAHTPLSYHATSPAFLSEAEAAHTTSRDIFQPLIPHPQPALIQAQLDLGAAFLRAVPLAHGALDMGIHHGPQGPVAVLDEIHAGPPGAFSPFWAPLTPYAQALAHTWPF